MTEIATPAPAPPAGMKLTEPDGALLVRHGITRDRDDHYRVDGLRYTHLADALTQVARRARSGRPGA